MKTSGLIHITTSEITIPCQNDRVAGSVPTLKNTSDSPSLVHQSTRSRCSEQSRIEWWWILRLLLLDVPLLLLFCLHLALHYWERFATVYLLAQVNLMKWTADRKGRELTYYHRQCERPSTQNASELVVCESMPVHKAADIMRRHGASIFPDILSEETATRLRDFILEENLKQEEMIYVPKNSNRWSFFLRVDQHPSVAPALEEILHHDQLISVVEQVVGPDPAVTELTTITAGYGAVQQDWHSDVVSDSNVAKYGRSFVPIFTLFVPLQNTTAGMGATGICPGTHMLAEGCAEMCDKSGITVAQANRNETTEYWPVGWGALVNQELMHTGTAHTDPHGPHRVVLVITFSPRPRFGEKQVETRMIPLGGSYSFHWSQWGHTLQDFANPLQRLRQPSRLLRCWGLLKSSGWDFFTQAAGRISNEQTGYFRDDLDTFLEKGGFFFLPRSLQGAPPPEDFDESTSWLLWMSETTHLVQAAVTNMLIKCIAFYLVLIVIASVVTNDKRVRTAMRSGGIRIALIMGTLSVVAQVMHDRFEDRSSWAHNIRQERQFNVPTGPHATLAHRPASLPLERDILIFDSVQSDYMTSFARVLELIHPGNEAWNEMVHDNAVGYEDLPQDLQRQLRRSLVQTAREQQRRIMAQNLYGNWAEVDDLTTDWFCHKELLSQSKPFIGKVMTWTSSLLSETQFGYWRDTALHRKHIPEFLMELQDKIIRLSRRPLPGRIVPSVMTSRTIAILSLLKIAGLSKRAPQHTRTSLPTRPEIAEPFSGAWLKEGDLVEATYQGGFQEWYLANITYASSDHYTWDVVYDNGEVDEGLCSRCVRRFVPYKIGEEVEVRFQNDIYFPSRVLAADDKSENYRVEIIESGDIVQWVPIMQIRRLATTKFSIGDKVLAQFPDAPGKWYPGVLVKVDKDDTCAIRLDDGGFVEKVPTEWVKLADEESSVDGEDVTFARLGGTKTFTIGSKVLVQLPHAKGGLLPGIVVKFNEDRTLAIRYDNGDYSPQVPTTWVIPVIRTVQDEHDDGDDEDNDDQEDEDEEDIDDDEGFDEEGNNADDIGDA